jgi:diguanylate cyclase (GGDEF)-like protein/PAS domain S-box-containing protein
VGVSVGFPAAASAGLTLVVVFATAIVFGWGGDAGSQVLSDLVNTAVPIAVSAACVAAALRCPPGRHRRGWLLVAVGTFAWGGGNAVWTWYELVTGREVPFPSLSDVGFLGMIPFLAAGVWTLVIPPSSKGVREFLDGGLAAISILCVSWVVLIGSAAEGESLLNRAVLVAYPLGDVVILSVVVIALAQAAPVRRTGLGLLAGGVAALAFADSGFLFLVERDLYASGNPIDAGWALGFTLVGLAAWREVTRPVSDATSGDALAAPGRVGSLLPYLAVLVALGTVVAAYFLGGGVSPGLFGVAAALVTLTVVRQMVTVYEVSALSRGLEATVRQRTADLRDSRERFRSLVEHSSDLITVVGPSGHVLYQSPAIQKLLGYRLGDLGDLGLTALVHPEDRAHVDAMIGEVAVNVGGAVTVRCRVLHADGDWRHFEATIRNLSEEQAIGGLVINSRDVTEQVLLEEQLTRQAFHDALTGLPNRALFVDRVEHAISRAARMGSDVAVLYLDLDGFKTVNDTFGHGTGDQLLVAVGERLALLVRAADTVARFGGDEFAILVEGDAAVAAAHHLAQRVLAEFDDPFAVQGRRLGVKASIGIAATATGLETPGDLLRDADVAMYVAKGRGKNRAEAFDPSMNAHMAERFALEADLRRSVDAGEMFLEFQPIVDLATERMVAAEALVRWRHPVRGVVPPDKFVGVAEDTGFIGRLGAWVLEQSCRQAAAWHAAHPEHDPIGVSVNLSTRQLRDPGFTDLVRDALLGNGLDPSLLTLEVTESFLLEDVGSAIASLEALTRLGVSVAIDDFGTGYSALGYLGRLPIDTLKVDRSFVSRIDLGTEDAALAEAIVRLGRTFRLDVVAEGVETPGQLAELRRVGCHRAQGFWFSRPVGPDVIDAMLGDGEPLRADPVELVKDAVTA